MTKQLNINPNTKENTRDAQNSTSSDQSTAFEPDDDMIYPDNHLDDDDRYFLFPGQNTD